ncbi:MAG: DUF4160 domain-containing protein [Melioribacteraceae bacterium]|jgi:hypothetical protein|nr:DUF4160 domain-containing protein [Melioribacteraceae bacterium]
MKKRKKKEWKTDFTDNSKEELFDSLSHGPIIDENGKRSPIIKQVDRFNGYKIEIFSNEHPPPHFRVKFSGETADYRIKDCEQISSGLDHHSKNVKEWHKKNKNKLIECWDSTRPTDCPVGKYKE